MKVFKKEDIRNMDLMLKERYETVIAEIPHIPMDNPVACWLQNGYIISEDGTVTEETDPMALFGIRPVFYLNTNTQPLKRGEKVKVGNIYCTAISICEALADIHISYSHYDEKTFKYLTSDIKELLSKGYFLYFIKED